MTTKELIRSLAVAATLAVALPTNGSASWTAQPLGPHSCSGEGLAQFECGNPQAIPDCEVTCFGKASCMDATCDPIYEEGPLGHTGDPIAYFYLGPVCACVGGWQRLDSVQNISCLAELFRRTDGHRSKTSKALSSCETAVLGGRVTLASGETCAENDQRTAAMIASSRQQAEQAITRKCPASILTELYGSDGTASSATFVDGLLRRAEEQAAAGIGLALRTAVVAP